MKATHYARLLPAVAATVACLTHLPDSATAQEFDPAKMEEVMKKYGTPGPEHKALKAWTGQWTAESKYWMMPDAPPMTSSGTAKVRLLLGGRYLSEQFTAESKEFGKFQGQSTLAYDRLAKEYIQTWIDTMGTGMMISRGKLSEDGKMLVMNAPYKDPLTMLDLNYRSVYHLGDSKQRKLEMFVTYPGKPEFKNMEIVYTKAVKPKKSPDKKKTPAKDKSKAPE